MCFVSQECKIVKYTSIMIKGKLRIVTKEQKTGLGNGDRYKKHLDTSMKERPV